MRVLTFVFDLIFYFYFSLSISILSNLFILLSSQTSLKNILLFLTTDLSKESFTLAASPLWEPQCGSCCQHLTEWVLVWRSPMIHELKLQWPLLSLCFFISATVEFFTTFSLKFSVPAACYWVLFTPAGLVKCFLFLPFFHLAQGPPRNNAPYSSLPVTDPVCAWRLPSCAVFPISLWAENVLSHLYCHFVPTWSTFDAFFIDSMILYTFSI